MSKWVELRAAQYAQKTAKHTKAMARQPAEATADSDARVAHLEGRVAALEARMQWAIDTIQRLQHEGQQPRQ